MEYEFKSDEERQFADWLEEAKVALLVTDWLYEPTSFELLPARNFIGEVRTKTKVKMVERCLHQASNYTQDFRVVFSEVGLRTFNDVFKKSMLTAKDPHIQYFDTKGGFSRQDDGRHFSLLQKLFYDKHGIWTEKIVPKKLFIKTYAPESVRWMKGRKTPTLTKIGTQTKTIGEFLKEYCE